MRSTSFFTRWRVRLGYPLAVVALLFARPTPRSMLYGAAIGFVGLLLRAYAAGYLRKQEVLATCGPYAYTRNPLYFGSALLTLGAAIAANSWVSAILLCAYFAAFYSVVMSREEEELRVQHGASFEAYSRAVPLFLPRLFPAKLGEFRGGSFSLSQYKKNREYRAGVGFLLLLALFLAVWRLRSA